ncbi:28S ribosomal protein S35 mitochondrial, partial [Clonorchis sinensis]
MVAGLKSVDYETHLVVLDLCPLEFRRLQGDLILTYVLFEQGERRPLNDKNKTDPGNLGPVQNLAVMAGKLFRFRGLLRNVCRVQKVPRALPVKFDSRRTAIEFCTAWPSGLNSDEIITKHYPLEIVQRTYVFSSHSIRDPRARSVTIQVPVSCLGLDEHSKRKLLRLAIGPGPGKKVAQYDWNTDILELTSGRCPSSRQNTDYLKYVLTVLTLESHKTETWEKGRPDYDWLMFHWPSSSSRENLLKLVSEAGNHEDKAIDCK